MKIFIAIVIVLVVLLLLAARKRRAPGAADRQRRRAHNSRRIRYSGFGVIVDDKGRRRVHTTEKAGRHACSGNCEYCRAGTDYQSRLRVFDDRPVRGRRSRRAVLRGDHE